LDVQDNNIVVKTSEQIIVFFMMVVLDFAKVKKTPEKGSDLWHVKKHICQAAGRQAGMTHLLTGKWWYFLQCARSALAAYGAGLRADVLSVRVVAPDLLKKPGNYLIRWFILYVRQENTQGSIDAESICYKV
jgi:hypothetical protein